MKIIKVVIDYKNFKYFTSISKAAKYLNCGKATIAERCKSVFNAGEMQRRIKTVLETDGINMLTKHIHISLVDEEIPIYRLDDGEFNPICVWVKCYNKDENNKGFEQPFFFKTKSDAAKYFDISRQEFNYVSKNIKEINKNIKYRKLYNGLIGIEIVDKSHELWNKVKSNDIISFGRLDKTEDD